VTSETFIAACQRVCLLVRITPRSYGPLYTAITTGALSSDHRKSRL
jgi:hypothetical protein